MQSNWNACHGHYKTNTKCKIKNHPAMDNSSLAQRQSKVVNIQNFISLERLKFYHSSLGGTPLRTIKQADHAEKLK